jgi:adenylate cyclase
MSGYTAEEAAARSGVTEEFAAHTASLGLVGGGEGGRFSDEDVRRLQVLQSMERAGLPISGIAELVSRGSLSLDFIESAGQYVFTPLEGETFTQVSETTGIPIAVVATIREALGGSAAGPDDRVSRAEMAVVPLVLFQLELGFRERAIEQALRVYGESMRRIAETEAEWFRSEIQQPMLERGMSEDDIGRFAAEMSPRLSELSDQAVMAIFHGQQGHAWLTNIIRGIGAALENADLHKLEPRVPAMCFLDITGYTNLTSERGDQAAANVAEHLRRVVQQPAMAHGGRAVKWLGDGVMFYFPDPGAGVSAAVEMVSGVESAGLPQAHVGLHAGPVVFQEGDYYGNTVNIAARIGEYARPGEVLVSQEVVDQAGERSSAGFTEIGDVRLKGVTDPVFLYAASATASRG